jgi:hypothetical protein
MRAGQLHQHIIRTLYNARQIQVGVSYLGRRRARWRNEISHWGWYEENPDSEEEMSRAQEVRLKGRLKGKL